MDSRGPGESLVSNGLEHTIPAAGEGVHSMFKGIVAVFVERGVQSRRLQVWTQKLLERGGAVRKHINKTVTHIFAMDVKCLEDRVGRDHLGKLRAVLLKYEWMEECLKSGELVVLEPYFLIHQRKPKKSDISERLSTIVDNDLGKPEFHDVELTHKTARKREESSESDEEASYKHRKTDDDWMDAIHRGAKAGTLGRTELNTAKAGTLGRTELNTSQGDSNSAADSPSDVTNVATQEQSQAEATYSPPNLNKNITDIFTELKNFYHDAVGDLRRSFSYHKAISVLEKLPFKITSVDDVKRLPSIGKSMQEHIAEILSTGTMAKLEHIKEDEKMSAISQLSSVWGIGPTKALELYAKGHRTLKDLKSEETLKRDQRIGLKFHDDINKRIPRHEVQEMEALVRKVAESIEKDVIVVCGGSYRRGKDSVGDMDIIITHPDAKSHVGYLHKLVEKLKEIDFLTEDLRLKMDRQPQEPERAAVGTYFGLCKYPGREQRHRIDIKVFPYEKYPYGLIAWTGNDVLNRRIRLLAGSKGYKLDDHGCYPVTKDANGESVANRDWSVGSKTEREVFDFLGFPWLEPHDRNL